MSVNIPTSRKCHRLKLDTYHSKTLSQNSLEHARNLRKTAIDRGLKNRKPRGKRTDSSLCRTQNAGLLENAKLGKRESVFNMNGHCETEQYENTMQKCVDFIHLTNELLGLSQANIDSKQFLRNTSKCTHQTKVIRLTRRHQDMLANHDSSRSGSKKPDSNDVNEHRQILDGHTEPGNIEFTFQGDF